MKSFDTFEEYQAEVLRTAPAGDELTDKLVMAGLGISGEAGEVTDYIKKLVFHGHTSNDAAKLKLAEEAGDVLWYITFLATSIGFTLADIANINSAKLRARYPDGFDTERSKNRKE